MTQKERIIETARFWLAPMKGDMTQQQVEAGMRIEMESKMSGIMDPDRLLDLARYCRATLLDDGLISVEEFITLTSHNPAARDMESFPALMRRMEAIELKALDAAVGVLRRLRSAIVGAPVDHQQPFEHAFQDAMERLATIVAPLTAADRRIDGKTLAAQWAAAVGTPVPSNELDPKEITADDIDRRATAEKRDR